VVVCSKDELKVAKVKVTLQDILNEDHLGGSWLVAHPRAKPAVDASVNYINSFAKNK